MLFTPNSEGFFNNLELFGGEQLVPEKEILSNLSVAEILSVWLGCEFNSSSSSLFSSLTEELQHCDSQRVWLLRLTLHDSADTGLPSSSCCSLTSFPTSRVGKSSAVTQATDEVRLKDCCQHPKKLSPPLDWTKQEFLFQLDKLLSSPTGSSIGGDNESGKCELLLWFPNFLDCRSRWK